MDENKQCMKECSWFKFLLTGPGLSQCTVHPLISWDVKIHEFLSISLSISLHYKLTETVETVSGNCN